MINVIYNDFSYEILPKRLEVFEKYTKIIKWGRQHPTRFIEDFLKIQLTDSQKYVILSSWNPANVVWVMSRSSGKALTLNTPVYYWSTPEIGEASIARKTIADLQIGDKIFDDTGNLTTVTHLNPIVFDKVYKLEFEDRDSVECNGEHLWKVYDELTGTEHVLETHYLSDHLLDSFHDFKIPVAEPINRLQKYKSIVKITKSKQIKPMRCITVDNGTGLFLCGNNYTVTHNSFSAAPFMMTRALLLPNTNTYIMGPSGGQAMETFQKMEDIAKGNIASLVGTSSVFLDECVRLNPGTDPFVHPKSGYSVELYNGSTINTLNSVAKNIVGIRSNFNVYDEGGKIPRDFYALTRPFTAQDSNFITGEGINTDIYPKQFPNKNLILSSAEGVDSELFDQFKIGYQKMLLGDPNYFVCSIDYSFSLHPMMNGHPMKPLVTKDEIENAFKVNPYKAQREYGNRFDSDGGENTVCKRSTILRNSFQYYPEFENDGHKKYIVSFDPSTKLDNSFVGVGELYRDEERGLMLKIVNGLNLVEQLSNGEKAVIQKPQQLEILKDLILSYNKGYEEYEGIDMLIIDAGAGGGGVDLAQHVTGNWYGIDKKMHRGFIDLNDPYMALRADDYPGSATNLHMFNFKRDKVQAYERAQEAINQGLVQFPKSLNARNEYEIEEELPDGTIQLRYEKVDFEEMRALIEIELMKQEIVGMQKVKKPNGTVVFETSPEGKQRGLKDDRADVLAMMCDRLMGLRAEEAMQVEDGPKDGFRAMFERQTSRTFKSRSTPFGNLGANPFAGRNGERRKF